MPEKIPTVLQTLQTAISGMQRAIRSQEKLILKHEQALDDMVTELQELQDAHPLL